MRWCPQDSPSAPPAPSASPHLRRMTTTNQRASARSLLLAALAFVLVWTWAHISADGSLDAYGDMLENFAWAQQWTWGTHKHPPFVAWVVRLWFAVWPVGDASYKLLAYVNAGVGLLGTPALARVVGLRGLGWLVLATASWGCPTRPWPPSSTPTPSCCRFGPGGGGLGAGVRETRRPGLGRGPGCAVGAGRAGQVLHRRAAAQPVPVHAGVARGGGAGTAPARPGWCCSCSWPAWCRT